MILNSRLVLSTLFVVLFGVSVVAQTTQDSTTPLDTPTESAAPDSSTSSPYTLKRGDNELGVWGGFSPKASTVFGGLTDAEADDRKFFLAAFHYGRTLAANDSVALQYTLDAIPVVLASGVIVSRTIVAGVTTFRRETAYGIGLTPLGLQLDFANGSKVHPFIHINGGFIGFNKSMPIEDSGQFALVGEAGGGVRIFTSDRKAITLGVRFHHISNGDTSGSNRGLNQWVIYGGFSWFK
jgi:hypothetical protein